MTFADIEAILAIEREAFRRPWTRDSFLAELDLNDSFNYTARRTQPDDILGYITLRILLGEVQILRVAVASGEKRQGIASRLLEDALSMAAESFATACFLETGISNTAAIGLYTRCGFNIVGKRPGYYPSSTCGGAREDAVIMKKGLGNESSPP